MEQVDPTTHSVEFARASNALIVIWPDDEDDLGVGIETGSVLKDIYPADSLDNPASEAIPTARSERVMVVTDPTVQWDARRDSRSMGRHVRSFSSPEDLRRVCAQHCWHIDGTAEDCQLPRKI